MTLTIGSQWLTPGRNLHSFVGCCGKLIASGEYYAILSNSAFSEILACIADSQMPGLTTPISGAVAHPTFSVRTYRAQARRAFGELQTVLANGNEWLVGGKCTIADLAFIA